MDDRQNQAGGTTLLLLERCRQGDESAIRELFDRYCHRLIALVRSRSSPQLARRIDPEDVVFSVFRSFFLAVEDGRFTLTRDGDLWRLLAGMTRRKLLRQVRRHFADCRSVDREQPLDSSIGVEPIAERPAEFAGGIVYPFIDFERLLEKFSPFVRRVAELRLMGMTYPEIASETGRSERTVRRALAQLKHRLQQDSDHE